MKKAGTVLDGAFSKLEENSLRTTKFFDIAGTYEKLKTLTEPVEMQLKELDFYRGRHGPEYDYIPDASYEPRHFGNWATDVHLEDILNNFDEGQITFVGPAGAGKTTLMKTVARNILSRKYDGLKGIKAVHYADLRKYRGDENMTVQDYLFLNNEVQLTTEERIAVVQYCISKPNQVIFIIDSLDTLQYSPDKGDSQMQIHEKRDPPTILRNLLSGSLLEKCRFITSSREYAIKDYDEKLRAKKVIALDGMSAKAMHEMIHQYLDEDDANELIAFLENHPILLTMSETPLFLALTVMVSKEVMSLKTQSVATVLICALQLFLRSAHNKGLDCPLEKIKKLEILAAKLTEEHRVLFGIGDLEEIGLLLEDVWDLAISSPKGPQQKLILGEEILFFAHQSIQELLTGFHFIRKNEEGFKEILDTKFHTDVEPFYMDEDTNHYSVVKRLLSGTLFDDDILKTSEFFGDLNEEDIRKKQILMRETIQDEVSQGEVSIDFALLIAECGSNLSEIEIPENVEIDAGHSTLTAGRGYALGLLLQRCTSVKILDISGGVQTEGLQNVYQQVRGLNLQIELLVLPDNSIGSSAMEVIGKLLCCSTVKMMSFGGLGGRFTASEVSSLGVNLDDNVSTKIIANLAIEEIVQEQVAGLSRFLDLIANPILNFKFSTQTNVGNCCLVFKEYLDVDPDRNFNYLELCNKLQQTKTLSSFGNLLKKNQIQRIKLTTTRDGYQPTVQEWKEFRKQLEGVKIKDLELDGFVKLDVEHCSEIGRLFENNHLVESFAGNNMTLKGLEEFKSRVLNTQFKTLQLNIISDEYDRCCYLSSQLMVQGRVERLTLCMGMISLGMTAQWNESGEYLDQLSIAVYSETVDVSSVLEGLKDKSIGLRKLVIDLLVTENFNSNVLFPIVHDVSEKIIIYGRMDERNIENLQEYMNEIYPTARNLRIDINRKGIQGKEQRKSIGGSAVGDILVPICINKSTEAVVPINGGMIRIDECTLNFLKTTFFKETGVKLKLSNDPRKWPPGFVAIAPLLEVDASGEVQQPVSIKMIAWCYNGSPEEAKDAKVFALHYSSKTSKWEELAVFPFGSDVVYEFQCESFSPIFLGIWEWFFGYASMAAEGLIFVSGDVYTLVLVPTRQCDDEMRRCRESGMRRLLQCSTVHVKRGDEIEMIIAPKSEGFRFSPEGKFTFKIDDKFMKMQSICRRVIDLESDIREGRPARFLCDITQNGKKVDDTHSFSVFWEHPHGQTTKVQASSGGTTYNIGPGSTVNTNQSTSATGVVSEGGSPNVTLQGSIDIAAASNSQ